MKSIKTKIVMLAILLSSNLNAQINQTAVNRIWTLEDPNTASNRSVVAKTDPAGNLVKISTIQQNGTSNLNLSCVHSDGFTIWQQNCLSTSNGNEYGVDLEIDENGNLYILGGRSQNNTEKFICAKLAPNGTILWTKEYARPTPFHSSPVGLELSESGQLFLMGTTGSSTSLSDVTILKLNPSNGATIWIKHIDQSGNAEVAFDLSLDNTGNPVFVGRSTINISESGIVVGKLNSNNGSLLNSYTHNSTSGGHDKPSSISIDEFDNMYIVGTSDETGNGTRDILAFSVDDQFQFRWEQIIDEFGLNDVGHDISYFNGKVGISGYSTQLGGGLHLFVSEFDAQTGNINWKFKKSSILGNERSIGHNVEYVPSGMIINGIEDVYGVPNMITISLNDQGELNWYRTYDALLGFEDITELVIDGDRIYSLGLKTLANAAISTVRYVVATKPMSIASDTLGDYISGELNIVVRPSLVNLQFVDKKELEFAIVQDVLDANLIAEMSNASGFDWGKLPLYKIHRRATSADSISINRDGDTVKLSPFWSQFNIELPEGIDELTAANQIIDIEGIFDAGRNIVYYPTAAPNDAYYYTTQKGLYYNVFTLPPNDIRVEAAWDYEVGRDYIKVGVFDDPLDWSHPDFGDGTFAGSKIAGGWDYVSNTDLSFAPFLGASHGTRVAGIVGALRNNNIGVAGVAGGDMTVGNTGAQLFSMGISYSNSSSGALFATSTRIAEAIIEGAAQTPSGFGYGLHIQNHSYGTLVYPDPVVKPAVKDCWKNACIFVASRGNRGAIDNAPEWPACFDDEQVINVMASGTDGGRKTAFNGEGTWGSSYGRTGANNTIACYVDVMAPGASELVGTTFSSVSQNNTPPTAFCAMNDPLYSCFSGTSAATPQVAGVLALMYSRHNVNNGYPNQLTTEDVEYIIENNALVPGSPGNPGYNVDYGYGRIWANRSLEKIAAPYYIKHSNPTIPTQTTIATNATVNVISSNLPFPSGTYLGNKYQLVFNINETLPANDEVIDAWELGSLSTVGSTDGLPTAIFGHQGFFNVALNVVPNSNQVTGTATTYAWYLTNANGSFWYPAHPSQIDFAFSIYAKTAPLAISELELTEPRMFPNPTTNDLTVVFGSNTEENLLFQLIDAQGRVMLTEKKGVFGGENEFNFDLSTYESGVYFVRILNKNNDLVWQDKLVKLQ